MQSNEVRRVQNWTYNKTKYEYEPRDRIQELLLHNKKKTKGKKERIRKEKKSVCVREREKIIKGTQYVWEQETNNPYDKNE